MTDETAQYDLRCLLDAALRQPFAEYRWTSRRARRHWYEIEPVLDVLAGPLVAIADRGDCGYVYREPERFPGVVDAPTFRIWAQDKLEAVREGVESFRPRTPAEHDDSDYMLDTLDALRTAVRLAVELELPAVDDRLARREEGEEYVDDERFGWESMAGDPEHADPQCQLAYVVRACAATGYVASTELLTRTDKKSDFATDVCVRRRGTDPETGGRYLEEISFEVANVQTFSRLETRAKKLVARGVRRVFGILVKEEKVQEWTRGGWKERPLSGEIRDRAFKKPLRIRAILDAADADRLVAEALWEKP